MGSEVELETSVLKKKTGGMRREPEWGCPCWVSVKGENRLPRPGRWPVGFVHPATRRLLSICYTPGPGSDALGESGSANPTQVELRVWALPLFPSTNDVQTLKGWWAGI